MRKYTLTFTGRKLTAPIAFTTHEVTLEAPDAAAARAQIYETYAHISGLQIMAADLPAFRLTFEDGSNYVTSMAHGTTLDAAKGYFLGRAIDWEEAGEETIKIVSTVEEVQP